MKGVAFNIGADELAAAVVKLELALLEERDPSSELSVASQLVVQVVDSIERYLRQKNDRRNEI